MNPFDLPEERSDPKMEEQPKDTPETIIDHTEVNNQPGNVFKKIIYLFKGNSVSSDKRINKPQEESKPLGPRRTSGQGLLPRSTSSGKSSNPDKRLRAFMSPVTAVPPAKGTEMTALPAGTPAKNEQPEEAPKKLHLRPTREKTRRAFWDVAGIFSLVVNAILVGALIVMYGQIRNLKTMMNGLLGGLYSNFVDMDKANIETTIPVEAQIPVVFNLPIQQNTNVTLTSAVPIPRTQVVINSGGLSINAPATVTLPEGTSLPIALNMDIPVQVTIPINLQIPVKIPMNQTDLHTPFTGLQQTIRPLYCTINKNAQYPQGIYICVDHTAPSSGTP
jgi:hypothetical protein